MWQQSAFTAAEASNPAVSGPTADPDGDGIQNLLEFALGTLPKTPGSSTFSISPQGTSVPSPQNSTPVPSLRLTTPATLPAGITLSIEGLNPAGQWQTLASATSTQDWTPTVPGWMFLSSTGPREVCAGWKAPAPAASMLRVRATYLP